MKRIVIRLERRVKMRIRRLPRSTRNAGLAMRCQIVLHADKGRPPVALWPPVKPPSWTGAKTTTR